MRAARSGSTRWSTRASATSGTARKRSSVSTVPAGAYSRIVPLPFRSNVLFDGKITTPRGPIPSRARDRVWPIKRRLSAGSSCELPCFELAFPEVPSVSRAQRRFETGRPGELPGQNGDVPTDTRCLTDMTDQAVGSMGSPPRQSASAAIRQTNSSTPATNRYSRSRLRAADTGGGTFHARGPRCRGPLGTAHHAERRVRLVRHRPGGVR